MNPIEAGLRRFLLVMGGMSCVALPVELLLDGHTESRVQLLPFVLCGLLLAGTLAFARWTGRTTGRLLRLACTIAGLGGVFGMWEHIAHNYTFEAEIRPTAPTGTLLWEALQGASPLLAPGALLLVALLLGAATWRHPALQRR